MWWCDGSVVHVGPGGACDLWYLLLLFVGEADEAYHAFSVFSADVRNEGEVACVVDVDLSSVEEGGSVTGGRGVSGCGVNIHVGFA